MLSKDEDRVTDVEASGSASSKPMVGRLTDDRIRRLQELGFVWSLRDDWKKVRIYFRFL